MADIISGLINGVSEALAGPPQPGEPHVEILPSGGGGGGTAVQYEAAIEAG